MHENKKIDQVGPGQSIPSIDHSIDIPIYKQICDGLSRSILEGRIAVGEKTPSIRELAKILGINRLTVAKAFDELVHQGVLKKIIGSGTYVIDKVAPQSTISFRPPIDANESVTVPLSSFAIALMKSNLGEHIAAPNAVSESGNVQLFEELPIDRWQRVFNRASRVLREDPSGSSKSTAACDRLRQAIGHFLGRSRGVECSAGQIVIFSQPEIADALICRLLLKAGDAAAVENPGCLTTRNALCFHGVGVVPISVDAQGPVIEQLYRSSKATRVIFVRLPHPTMTQINLTVSRRSALLRWAQKAGAIIIEDDCDGQYRSRAQIPLMMDPENNGNVIYRYNFGKVLSPLVRAGFLVVPPALAALFNNAMQMLEFDMSPFEQRALADFIDEGYYERHLKQLRTIYSARRASLTAALTVNFGKAVSISNARVGRQMLILLPSERSDEFVLSCARKAGFPLASTSSSYVCEPKAQEFLVDCSSIREDDIRRSVDVFAALAKAPGDRIENLPDSWFQPNFAAKVSGTLIL